VPGPLDVIGPPGDGRHGGVLHEDLREAALRALAVPRQSARERALTMDWDAVCRQFIGYLVPAHDGARNAVIKTTTKLHKLV
jgi:hypothetical protein